MMKKYKMNGPFAFIVAFVMLCCSAPLGVVAMPEEDDSENSALVWNTVHLAKGAFAREMLGPQGRALFYVDGGPGAAARTTYLNFDLADYLNGTYGDISIEELRLKINVTERPFAGTIGVYILPKELSDFDPAAIDGPTVNAVNSKTGTSMINDESNFAAGIPHGPNEPTFTGDIWPAVKKYLDANPGTTSFTIRLSEIKKPAPEARVTMAMTGATANSNEPILRVGFKTEEMKQVEEAISGLSFDKLSLEDIQNVTRNLSLPEETENGVSVTWESSDAETVNPSTGVVERPSFGENDKQVTLTGIFSYQGQESKVDYAITVLAERANPAYSHNTLPIAADGHGTLLKVDLSDYQAKLDELDSILLKLVPRNSTANAGDKHITVYMTDETNTAGMLGDKSNPIDTFTGQLSNSFYSGDLLPAVKQYFSSHPAANGTVTFRMESKNGEFLFHGADALSDDLKPGIIAVSYEDALKETIDYLTPDRLYEGSIDRVRGDLDLFTQWKYSAKIDWRTSAPDIITPAGTVNRPAENTTVILTATVTSGTRSESISIPVTVLGTNSDSAYFRMLLDSISFDRTVTTDNFTLPVMLEQMTVVWTPEDPGVTTVDGGNVTVTRLKGHDCLAKITATISDAGVTESKDFYFTVIRHPGNDKLMKQTILDENGTKINAIDDNLDSRWTIETDRTITIDAGNPRIFAEFLLAYDGPDTAGLTVQASQNAFVWNDIYTSGTISPGTAAYLTLDAPVYARYVRFILPDGINGVRFLGGYSATTGDSRSRSILEKIALPGVVTENISLPAEAEGYPVTWMSGDPSVIRVSDGTAIVERQLMDRTVDMVASIMIDQKPYSICIPVLVQKLPSASYHNTALWSKEYMIYLWEQNIISEFNPNNDLKREEMAKMITLGFSLENEKADVPFTDMQSDAWYYGFVSAMYNSGITNGIGNNTFGVGLNISRQDAALQIARILENKGILSAASEAEHFADDWEIADYAKESVYALRELGILNGDDNGNFRPGDDITRAEMAKLLVMALHV